MKDIIAKYKQRGFRLTPQRIAILKFLEGNKSHPTAEDILKGVRKEYPTISVATVYNTLQKLKEDGDIQEITIDPYRKHYDPDTSLHHHIICIGCNEIKDIFEDYGEVLKPPHYISRDYRVLGNHIDFYGLCKKCQRIEFCELDNTTGKGGDAKG